MLELYFEMGFRDLNWGRGSVIALLIILHVNDSVRGVRSQGLAGAQMTVAEASDRLDDHLYYFSVA